MDQEADVHDLDDSQLLEVTEFVWNSTLGLILEPAPREEPASDEGARVSAVVDITGAWAGSIHLTTTTKMAGLAAARMFGCGEDEVSEPERLDAVGELANQIGGSVKSLLPGPCSLSLPRVWVGVDDPTGAGRPAGLLAASSDGHPVEVVVVEGDAVPA
jgi:chemotaxis protein CheX